LGTRGWGFGIGINLAADGPQRPGSFGWAGGLGSVFAGDPSAGVSGVLLTNQMWTSPDPPAVCDAFWDAAYALAR
jgi:CubicO group peptidase (beta-lactamase class C family)